MLFEDALNNQLSQTRESSGLKAALHIVTFKSRFFENPWTLNFLETSGSDLYTTQLDNISLFIILKTKNIWIILVFKYLFPTAQLTDCISVYKNQSVDSLHVNNHCLYRDIHKTRKLCGHNLEFLYWILWRSARYTTKRLQNVKEWRQYITLCRHPVDNTQVIYSPQYFKWNSQQIMFLPSFLKKIFIIFF